MRERRGELPDRGRARDVGQLSAALGNGQLGGPELGDLGDRADEWYRLQFGLNLRRGTFSKPPHASVSVEHPKVQRLVGSRHALTARAPRLV